MSRKGVETSSDVSYFSLYRVSLVEFGSPPKFYRLISFTSFFCPRDNKPEPLQDYIDHASVYCGIFQYPGALHTRASPRQDVE